MKLFLELLKRGTNLAHQSLNKAKFEAMALLNSDIKQTFGLTSTYIFECFDAQGNLKWREVQKNLVVNEGLDDNLDKYFKGAAYTADFSVGLTGGTPTFAPTDTLASAPGWTEFTNYTEADRQALVLGTVAAQSVDNSASRAIFTMDVGGGTIGGAFVATDNTKGGTTGVLYGGAAFPADRVLLEGDQLLVTVILSAASL